MAQFSVRLVLSLAVVAMAWRAYGQDDFNLEDAFDDVPTKKPKPAPKPPKIPTRNTGAGDFDLSDFFDATQPPKVVPKRPTKKPDVFIPTKKPRVSTPKPPKKQGYDDFNLEDALDNRNDPKGRGSTISDKDKPQGGRNADIADSDLEDLVNGGYKPDKGKDRHPGGRAGDNENYDNSDLKMEPTASSVCEIKQGKDPGSKPKNPGSSTNVAIKKVLQNLELRVLRMQLQLKTMQNLLADLTDLL